MIVEVDVGMGRCGVRSKEEALEVARHARGLPGIEWRGAMGYEGHCMLEPDREVRVQKQGKAVSDLLAVVDHLAGRRHRVRDHLRGRHRHLRPDGRASRA